ncbi:MAG: T9SS type A sorting domain-containing protein [Cytophagaceae bacterium]|nr:T9SS type A sorting domain-containing protein [Cytophagaceae bacterium]
MHLFLFFAGVTIAVSQVSGTINTYTKVTAVDYLCNFITVTSSTGFAAGDKVLLIQMQGATINQTNSVAYGDITTIGDAGNYEFAIIDHFVANNVYFSKTLLRTYTVSGAVQMISVPQYADISVDSELTPKPWDGTSGGVIVLESSGMVTLNANINVSEKGFRGGDKSTTGGSCTSSGNSIYTYSYPNINAGQKGEGLTAYVLGQESGRAKQANGGGGGNSHNTGGGGGGNFGAGGRGGDKKTTGCGIAQSPFGYGAVGLSTTYYSNAINRIFMGGGGGGGQQNNGLSYNAGGGGGIIIIKASTLNTNGFSVKSNGGSVASDYNSSSPGTTDNGDGNSGGGAGGTILLDISTYIGTTTLEAAGGKGGNTGYLDFDYGPGGGGGGGVLWSSSPVGASLSANVSAGTAGISGTGRPDASHLYGSGTAWGATNGTAGNILNSLSVPQSTSTSSCALPVELLSFQAKATGKYIVQVTWSTATELNNAFFSLEKSTDGIHFSAVAHVAGQEYSHQLTPYIFTEEVSAYALLYYRLWQTDIDGHTVDLGIRKVYPELGKTAVLSVYPNPCKEELLIPLLSSQKEHVQHLVFVNSIGEMLEADWEETETILSIDTSALPPGLYSLIINNQDHNQIIKVLKEQ